MPLKQPYCLHTYVCNLPDQLTSYDGESITYDASGNPTNYLGATLVWEGQRLKSYTPKASSSGHANSYVYSYDENGIRTRKTIGNTVTDYYYNGTLLMGTVKTTTNSNGSTTTSKLRFSYDANGKVVAVNYNGNYYYYLRNAQNDIVKLIDKTGATVVEYRYDSWGKLLSTSGSLASTLGKNNPFRYRGYVYDEETDFYYLQSRYYNPEVGRFISSDVLLSTGQGVLGHNAYAYCGNNPIVREDTQSNLWGLIAAAVGAVTGAVVGAVTGAVTGAITALASGSDFGETVVAGIASGAAAGAITGAAVGIASDVVSVGIAATIVIGGGVLSGVASELIDAKISKRHSTVADFVISGLIGGVGSLIGYGAGGGHEVLVAVKGGVKELVGSFKKTVFKKVARNFFNDKLEEIATGSVFGVIEMAFNEALHRRAKLFFPDLGE